MDTIFNKIEDFLKEVEGYTGIAEYVGDRKFSEVMHNPSPELMHLVGAIELLVEIQASPVAYIPFHDVVLLKDNTPAVDITDVKLNDMSTLELMPNTRVRRIDDRVYLTGEETTND